MPISEADQKALFQKDLWSPHKENDSDLGIKNSRGYQLFREMRAHSNLEILITGLGRWFQLVECMHASIRA